MWITLFLAVMSWKGWHSYGEWKGLGEGGVSQWGGRSRVSQAPSGLRGHDPRHLLAPSPPGWNPTLSRQKKTTTKCTPPRHFLLFLPHSFSPYLKLKRMTKTRGWWYSWCLKPWSGYPVFQGMHIRDSQGGGENEMRSHSHRGSDIWWQWLQWLLAKVHLFGFVVHVEFLSNNLKRTTNLHLTYLLVLWLCTVVVAVAKTYNMIVTTYARGNWKKLSDNENKLSCSHKYCGSYLSIRYWEHVRICNLLWLHALSVAVLEPALDRRCINVAEASGTFVTF